MRSSLFLSLIQLDVISKQNESDFFSDLHFAASLFSVLKITEFFSLSRKVEQFQRNRLSSFFFYKEFVKYLIYNVLNFDNATIKTLVQREIIDAKRRLQLKWSIFFLSPISHRAAEHRGKARSKRRYDTNMSKYFEQNKTWAHLFEWKMKYTWCKGVGLHSGS